MVFIFNFHPTKSFSDYRIPAPDAKDYKIILSTDESEFSGFDNVQAGQEYPWQDVSTDKYPQSIQIYIPSRTAQVLI